MFRTASPGRERTAKTFTASLQEWHDTSDNWFDGSVNSVDRRLASCSKLLHIAEAQVAKDPAVGQYLTAAQELSADREALASLRQDLLTAGSDREVGVSPPGRTASTKAVADLPPQARRWVELESAKFIRANADAAHALDELSVRARSHAELHTGQLGTKASRAITAAFVGRVLDRGRTIPRPRVAAAPATIPDFPDQLIFLA
jgi:hypothetical protein